MLRDLRAFAASDGLTVIAEHVDDGISGAVRDRPEFIGWLNDARHGRTDVLLAYHADRLTREGVNAAALILDVIEGQDPETGRVVRQPVRLATYDGLDSERDAEAFRWRFVIAAEVARAERQPIQSRNLATQRRLREAGRFTGGAVPFGCRVEIADGGKVLVRNHDEATVLEDVAGRVIRGDSIRAVVRWLNVDRRSRTRRGLEWQRSSLLATLRSTSSREHVLDLATFRAVQGFIGDRSSSPRKASRPQTALLIGGQGICESCGRSLTTDALRAAETPNRSQADRGDPQGPRQHGPHRP